MGLLTTTSPASDHVRGNGFCSKRCPRESVVLSSPSLTFHFSSFSTKLGFSKYLGSLISKECFLKPYVISFLKLLHALSLLLGDVVWRLVLY